LSLFERSITINAMVGASDLKNGTTYLYNEKPFRVIRYAHSKLGRGGATIKITARNLMSGSQEEQTFTPNNKFDEISTRKRELQYLYNDGTTASFMDPMSFEQMEIPLEVLGDDIYFVKEGETANVLFWDERPLSVEIPPKVTLRVEKTDPGVKGNSATNMYKPAILENGLSVKVPLFIKQGDKIRVDTRNSEYVERAND